MNGRAAVLKARIEARRCRCGVVGIGYVGLPLIVAMAKSGYNCVGIDVDRGKVEMINRGESYIEDVPSEEVAELVRTGRLRATTDYCVVRDLDVVDICVPTPLRKSKEPDMSYVNAAVEEISRYIRPGQLVILESTTYPGTTEELVKPKLESSGLKVGEDIFLAYSPERIDPGNKTYTIYNTPKIVGGITPTCAEVAKSLYGQFVNKVITISSTRAAEMVKLLENTFRSVNIGLVNEMMLMCDRMGLDIWEIVEAAATKPFGFMPFYPGPGIGGHCIPLDPHYLAWKAKSYQFYARFIELASEINGNMPRYVLGKIIDALNSHGKPVRGSRILILGVAYKRDVGDTRESPAIDIIRMLDERGADLSYYDPYARLDLREMAIERCEGLTPETLEKVDCVVIVTDHSCVDYQFVVKHSKLVVDCRNATKRVEEGREKVVRI